MLTTQPGFTMPRLPPAERNILEQTARLMRPFKGYLADDTQSKIMKMALRDTFEGFAQFRALPYLAGQGLIARPTTSAKARIGYATIAANPLPYARLTLRYAIDFWATNAFAYAIVAHGAKPPVFTPAVLNRAIPPWFKLFPKRHGDLSGALVTFPAYMLLGAACLLLSLWLAWVWLRVAFGRLSIACLSPATMLASALFAIGQTNIVFVSMVNITGGRFLIPIFPFFVLAFLVWLQSLPVIRRYSPARD